MANNSGIIFADLFINDKDFFIKEFSKIYEERQPMMEKAILDLDAVLQKSSYKTITQDIAQQFKLAWNNFERVVLLNEGDLQLLVAYRGQSGLNAEFSKIINQEEVEGVGQTSYGTKYGIVAGSEQIRKTTQDFQAAAQANSVEQVLQKHLNEFLNQLDKEIGSEDASNIHMFHEYCLSSYLQKKRVHLTKKKWWQAFYSTNEGYYFSGRGLGQAYDAFMNHMANKEKGIYDYLSSSGLKGLTSIEKMMSVNKSVYEEEGGTKRTGRYPELLKNSTNHVGWYTGGDIVIINPKTMQVVYNIQLKTTTRNKASVFEEKISNIREFLKGFIKLTPEEKGEKIFDFFLTSVSNHDDFNKKPQQEINMLLEENLSKKVFNYKI